MNKDKIIDLCIFHIEQKDKEIFAIREETQADIKLLQVEVNDLRKACKLLKAESMEDNKELQADNKRLKVDIKSLIDKLQAVNNDYNNDHKVHNEYEDGLLEEIKELKAEIKKHEKQYHMMASSKEYQAEADEYFSHNPQSKGLLFFMIDKNDFTFDEDNNGCNGTSGEYNNTLYTDDCLIEIDNEERS